MFGGWKLSYYTVLAIVVPTYKCLPICTGTRRPHFVSNKYSSRLKIGPFLKRLIAAASSVPIAYDETALKKPVLVTSVSQHLEQKASLTPSRPALQRWREGEGAGGSLRKAHGKQRQGKLSPSFLPSFSPAATATCGCPLARRGQYGRLRIGGPTGERGFRGNQCFSGASWSSHRSWPPSSSPSPGSGATANTAVSTVSIAPLPSPI